MSMKYKGQSKNAQLGWWRCSSQHEDQPKLPGLQTESMLWNRKKKVIAVADLLYDQAIFKLITHHKTVYKVGGVTVFPNKSNKQIRHDK